MIGSLLKYDEEKRQLFRPNAPTYKKFDQQVGLCISYVVDAGNGDEHVRVQWLRPKETQTKFSDFGLNNFIVIEKVNAKK